ncbi:MAG: ferredoxin [Desulfobacca sp.]|uniref:ferredoxin n=1 Tax=Desulfobacca sp. TaxID=2067990 RepID=UPI00404B2EF0
MEANWCGPAATWRQRQQFREAARGLVRLPQPQEEPLAVLLAEADWLRLVPPAAEAVLPALSHDTGVYFFPSREWVARFCRFIHLLQVQRVLEAGAGRGYLAAALAPCLARQGVAFLAVDNGQGEFDSGLPRHPVVQAADALDAIQNMHPEFVLYAWPPPGQSIGPLLAAPGVRYVLVMGERHGGCTGNPADWQNYPHREIGALSRLGLSRSGRRPQAATLFLGRGGATPPADCCKGRHQPTLRHLQPPSAARELCHRPIIFDRQRRTMTRTPVIDETACIGCNACVEACPEVFVLNESLGWAMVLFPDGAPEEKIQEAIDICPVHCITWSE